MNKKIIILLLIFSSTIVFGKNFQKDTIGDTNKIKIHTQLLENLDSLSTLWYVQKSLDLEKKKHKKNKITGTPEFSDSILSERLSNIPSVIALPYNSRVKAFINLYVNKRRGQVESMLGLTEYYFPIFEEILDKEGLPHEFKYLSLIESALNPRAVSRAGATGIWQFMYTTGKIYGLEINSFVDERRDPIKATYAAAAFLKDLYELYGDWTLALAAYNCGAGNVNKAIRRSGGKTDFWEIFYYLPRETRGYVPSFIAASYFMHYHSEHNLEARKISYPVFCDTIMIDKELHLKQVSEVLNIDIEQLRDLNPQYRTDIIPAKTKTYSLKLPAEAATRFIDNQENIFTYKDSIFFNPKLAVVSPPRNQRNRSYNPPTSKNKTAIYYRVKSGDNLGFISSWYNVRISDLRYWNNIRGNMIRVGQKLVIYVPTSKAANYSSVDNKSFAQKQRAIGGSVKTNSTKATKTVSAKKLKSGSYFIYVVKSGDNPWTIAQKYSGVSSQDILDLNGISNSRGLKPGQKIKIPKR